MEHTYRLSVIRPLLTMFVAAALLVSGCSEAEGPLPLRQEEARYVHESRVSRFGGEIPAPKGSKTLTIRVSSSPDTPVESVPEEEGFTRAVIQPDDKGAAVLWEAGDSIKVQFLKDGVLYYAGFRAEEGGSSRVLFSTDDDILGGTDYIYFTPGYKKHRETNYLTGKRIFGLEVPAGQTAVAEGVMAGSNLAFALSDSFESGMSITFTNLPALLRFSLSGDIASRVKEVTLKTTAQIAGDAIIYDAGGYPDFHHGKISGDEYSTSITLTGDFEPGKEYHIALWPKEVKGFEMELSDGLGHGAGHSTTVRSSKELCLERSVVTDIGTIDLGDSFRGVGNPPTDPIPYLTASEGTKPVSIAVVPDGFTLEELPMYESLAKMALDLLFDTEPYKTYKNRFNAWILKVASNQSGAGITDGNGNVVTPVNNYFGTKWGAESYGDMRANDTKVYNFVTANCPDISSAPASSRKTIDEVPVIIIVNDNRYAGRAIMAKTGRGYCMCPWSRKGESITWYIPSIIPLSESNPKGGYRSRTEDDLVLVKRSPGDWRHTVVHEFGHVFGRLADEYWSSSATTAKASTINAWHNYSVPYAKNVSSSYSTTPWDSFIQKRNELMVKDQRYSRIGKFQGGGTYAFGCWRSEYVSGMMDNRLYFNAWSRYLIVQRIMTLSGDLASFSFDSWLAKDVTTDPLRDGDGFGTRSGDSDRSGKYYYIFPHDPEEYLPPDAPVLFVDDEPAPPGI